VESDGQADDDAHGPGHGREQQRPVLVAHAEAVKVRARLQELVVQESICREGIEGVFIALGHDCLHHVRERGQNERPANKARMAD